MNKSKKTAFFAILITLSLILGYLEFLFFPPIKIPGVKLGFSNIPIIICIYILGEKNAFLLAVVKVLLSSLLFGGFSAFIFSASGALLSFIIMCIGKNLFKLSITGTSILGGVFHNVGQILAFAFTTDTMGLSFYLPVLIVSGIVTGAITGMISQKIILNIGKY